MPPTAKAKMPARGGTPPPRSGATPPPKRPQNAAPSSASSAAARQPAKARRPSDPKPPPSAIATNKTAAADAAAAAAATSTSSSTTNKTPAAGGVKKTAKFAALSVSVPPQPPNRRLSESQSYKDVELALRKRVSVSDASDVEAARVGYISGPCDCFLTIWAGLGEAIEAGAEQVVGLTLLPISGALYYLSSIKTTFIALSTPGVDVAPPAPPAAPDLGTMLLAASSDYALLHPVMYLVYDLGGMFVVGLLVLFEADLARMYADCRTSVRLFCNRCCAPSDGGYDQLTDVTADTPMPRPGLAGKGDAKPIRLMREGTLKRELHKAIDATEELEFKLRVRRASDAETAVDEELQQQQNRRAKLQSALESTSAATSPDARPHLKRARASWVARCMANQHVQILAHVFWRALNGLVAVWLYFADVISDIEVMLLLAEAGKTLYASIAGSLLVLQFFLVWRRVLPYLESSFGEDSAIYSFFLWFGFPFGMIGLDFLMFLEPFGLLPIAPIGERMRQFIPAYKSTRIIAEVLFESLPQCLLQSYILVTVMHHLSDGTMTPSEQMLLDASIDGSTFAQILPRSIAISTITSLKAWIELVYSAREAGISVGTKASQLLYVGFGLPFDALKRGTIHEWSCAYSVEDGEVAPLLDALIKNSSLVRLNLSGAGLEWSGPEASRERSGAPIIEAMAENPLSLAELQCLIVSATSGYEIPISNLRKGGTYALGALNASPFLQPGGPRAEEILLMGDLLRKNRRKTVVAQSEVEASAKAVMALLEGAKRGEVSIALWEERLKSMMVSGDTRRAHMKSLLEPIALHDVGFSAKELLPLGFNTAELKAGGFGAQELKAAGGLSNAQLKDLGYTPLELKDAGLSAKQLKELKCSAAELHEAGFLAAELKAARYLLTQLREAEYSIVELKEAGYDARELRAASVPAAEMRKSKAFGAMEMRDAGYTASEMKEAGLNAAQLKTAGYDANEATKAGYLLEHLNRAGYKPEHLRLAGHSAPAMRAAGYDLDSLKWAGYIAAELNEAGFDAVELKENGIGLFHLKQANTPVATLKEAGYKADRLKLQGYTAGELAQGGYTAKELRGFKDALYATDEREGYAGYTAKELREGQVDFSAADLKAAGYGESELRDGGWTAAELKGKGFSCLELKAGGFTAKELHEGGFSVEELKDVGHSALMLRAVDISAAELLGVGYKTRDLRKGGFSAAECKEAGVTSEGLREGGYSPQDLVALGVGPAELKEIGFGVDELRQAGFTAKELFTQGFTAKELGAGGFEKRAIDAVSLVAWPSTADALRAKGFSPDELRVFGFTAAELRAGGYTCKDMKRIGGYTDAELREGGFKARTVEAVDGRGMNRLRKAGYSAKELSAIGYTASELVSGGYTAKVLREIGFTVEELKAAGCTPKELRDAGFGAKLLRGAGFSLRELREGTFPWNELVIFLRCTHAELVDAGYEGIDPKDRLFMQYRPDGGKSTVLQA